MPDTLFSRGIFCFIFSLLILSAAVCPAHAAGEFKVPDCATLEKWSSIIPLSATYTEMRDPEFVERRKAALKTLLSDDVMVPVFGVANGMWDHTRKKPVSEAVFHCIQTLTKEGKGDAVSRLMEANRFVGRPWSEPRTKDYRMNREKAK